MVGDGIRGCLSWNAGIRKFDIISTQAFSWPQAIVMLTITSTSNTRKIATIFLLKLSSDYTVCRKFSSGLFFVDCVVNNMIVNVNENLSFLSRELRQTHQCCRSGMFIPDPGSWFLSIPAPGSQIPDLGSWIPDPTTAPKEEGKIFLSYHFCSHKYHKIVNNFIFEQVKNFLAKALRIVVLFTHKFVIKLSKIWVWNPGSGKNLFRIPDPGSKRHRIPDPDPQQWTKFNKYS